jgi:flagellar biogenesis protein FliO
MKKMIYIMCLFFTGLYAADAPNKAVAAPSAQVQDVTPASPPTTPLDAVSIPEMSSEPPSYEYTFVKMIVSLTALLILIFLTVWALKKLSHGRLRFMNQSLGIKILEKRSLSPKSILYLVEIGGQKVLISESQLEVRKLVDIEEPEDEENS